MHENWVPSINCGKYINILVKSSIATWDIYILSAWFSPVMFRREESVNLFLLWWFLKGEISTYSLTMFSSLFYRGSKNDCIAIDRSNFHFGWKITRIVSVFTQTHTHTHTYIYIYNVIHTQTFVLSELFSVARHAGRPKPGSKPVQLYVRLSFEPIGHQADYVG